MTIQTLDSLLLESLAEDIRGITDEDFLDLVEGTFADEFASHRRMVDYMNQIRRGLRVYTAPPIKSHIRDNFLQEIIEKAFWFKTGLRLSQTALYFTNATKPSEITMEELKENWRRLQQARYGVT